MKIIEIYDKDHPIFNIMSHVLYPDAQIVYFGMKNELGKKQQGRLLSFFKKRMAKEPEFIIEDSGDLDVLKERLSSCADGDTWFEVRGGNDIALVALGLVAAEKHISMFQINHNTCRVQAVLGELPAEEPQVSDLKFEELISLTGGCIGANTEDNNILLSPKRIEDIEKLWSWVHNDLGGYNRRSSAFVKLVNSHSSSSDFLKIDIPAEMSQNLSEEEKRETIRQINMLKSCGFISVQSQGEEICFRYRDMVYKAVMDKSGLLFELIGKIAACDTGLFSDVRHGVRLDWDGALSDDDQTAGTNNEVDLVLVKGFSVIFISCKSGQVEKEALYELEAVAHRFDIGNTKLVLLCDEIPDNIRQRANDMNIRLIDDMRMIDSRTEMAERMRGIM